MKENLDTKKKIFNKLGEFSDPKWEAGFRQDYFRAYKKFSALIIAITGTMMLLFLFFDIFVNKNTDNLWANIFVRLIVFFFTIFASIVILRTRNIRKMQTFIIVSHTLVIISYELILLFITENNTLQSLFLTFIVLVFAISLTPSRWLITIIYVPISIAVFASLLPLYFNGSALHVPSLVECIIYLFISGFIGIASSLAFHIMWRKQFITKLELEESSITDSLTQIYNRYKFDCLLNSQVRNSLITGATFSLIMYDIDDFKSFNDKYGHMVGDKILVSISKVVSASIRKSDSFARWGGEEFVVLLPGTELKDAAVIAEKIRLLIETNNVSIDLRLTVSVGVASFTTTDDIDSILRKVDSALYQAKKEGKNKVVVAN